MTIKDTFSTTIIRQTTVAGRPTAELADGASIQEKWNALRNIRNNIQGADGNLKSGYVSVALNGDQALLGRDNSLFSNRSRKEAGTIVVQMLKDIAGEKLADSTPLNQAIDAYFVASKGQFGTQSFAKIFDRLEAMIDPKYREAVYKSDRLNVSIPLELKVPAQIGQTAKLQLAELSRHIDEPSARYFRRLLNPPQVNIASLSQPANSEAAGAAAPAVAVSQKTVVVGDGDGSIGRIMLAAIRNGQIKLDREGFKQLGEILVAEHRSQNSLGKFQADQTIASKIEDVIGRATFSQGDNKLIFIGDILHDRFSNNKVAMKSLIETLHGQGVVFIKGNHDVYDEVDPSGDLDKAKSKKHQDYRYAEQNGFLSAKGLTKQESDEVVAKCFVNAVFDETNGILYTHNGIEKGPQEGTYATGLGVIAASNPKELADKLNAREYRSDDSVFTSFRPADTAMQMDKLGSIGEWNDRKVIFVHGHDSDAGVLGNVVNVNARADKDFCPASAELG